MESREHRRLDERMDRLEAQVRRWRVVAGGSLGLVVLVGILGAAPADEIRTKQLLIEGPKGLVRAGFTVSEQGTMIVGLLDGYRKTRASFYVYEDGRSGVSLADRSGIPRVQLQLKGGEVGDASVRVNDPQETPAVEMRADAEGRPSLRVSGPEGKALFAAP